MANSFQHPPEAGAAKGAGFIVINHYMAIRRNAQTQKGSKISSMAGKRVPSAL
jgi:hypothetical protein